MEKMRLDKWLWAARFYKTRSIAVDAIDKGRVQINHQACKPASSVKVGDQIGMLIEPSAPKRLVEVLALSEVRGPAPTAQLLYRETPDSLTAKAHWQEQKRLQIEPAWAQEHGRPTKKDRRDLAQWQRWSAVMPDSSHE